MKIRLEHIVKRFDDNTAVNDFSAVIESGELVTLLGPSGCGKSTRGRGTFILKDFSSMLYSFFPTKMLGVALPFGFATPTFIIEPLFYRCLRIYSTVLCSVWVCRSSSKCPAKSR